jgi:hypothetical protein
MLTPAGLRRCRGDPHQQLTTAVVRNQTIHASLLKINGSQKQLLQANIE